MIELEVNNLGRMNGPKIVEYLNEMNEILKQTKDIVEAEKQKLANPQSKIKPDVTYIELATIANKCGYRALFDKVLDLEVKRAEKEVPELEGLAEKLQIKAQIYFNRARTMGERIIVLPRDSGAEQRPGRILENKR